MRYTPPESAACATDTAVASFLAGHQRTRPVAWNRSARGLGGGGLPGQEPGAVLRSAPFPNTVDLRFHVMPTW